MRHAFTVDLEDWFQGIPISAEARAKAERRLERGTDFILDLMARHGQRGTFFVLGPVAEEYPSVVRKVSEAGHEIGCHGWSHDLLYEMTPERFHAETRRATEVISGVTGRPVTAYRAAYFSITRRTFWALEVLARLGYRYDSSIFPVHNWRYGIPDFEPRPQRVETPAGPIMEFPLSVRSFFGHRLPAAGGAYFRIYPYALTRSNIRHLEARGRPVLFYIHPWELDPDHPRIPFHWKPRLTHYVNLRYSRGRLTRLLSEFQFGPLQEVLEHELV